MKQKDDASLPQPTIVFHVERLSDIKSKPIDWLWHGWIARSALCVVTGRADVGKSWLILHLTSQITQAGGNVLLIDAENDESIILAPRLEQLGADMSRITHHTTLTERGMDAPFFISKHLDALEQEFATGQYDLVCIDPLNAYLGLRVDNYNDAGIRMVLGPLHRLAGRYNLAIVSVVHFRKSGAEEPLDRINGSVGYGAAARTVIWVSRDPESNRRTVTLLKNNLIPESEKPKPQDFDLSCGFRWLGDSPPRPQLFTRPQIAEAFLKELLADGPLPSSEVLIAAQTAGFGERMVELARASLGIKAVRQSGHWYLALAREATPYSSAYSTSREPQRDENPPGAICPHTTTSTIGNGPHICIRCKEEVIF